MAAVWFINCHNDRFDSVDKFTHTKNTSKAICTEIKERE